MFSFWLILGVSFIIIEVYALETIDDALSVHSNFDNTINKRIVGGEKVASPNDYPWTVGILYKSRNILICGGTLITDRHVLTAAHCSQLFSIKADDLFLRLGSTTLSGHGGIMKAVKRVIVHEKYGKPIAGRNDIAILEMDSAITLPQEGIKTICLGQKGMAEPGVITTVVGFGHEKEMGRSSDVLRQVTIPIVSDDHCHKMFGGQFTRKMICAGMHDGSKDSCQGDSGGPIMVKPNDNWYVVGVVSFGSGCAKAGTYGVYTRIAQFQDWITKHVDGATLAKC